MKKILLSLAILAVAGVAVIGGTTAIFSDTEVSTGNTFTAGAIDLTVDNESYYNGVLNEETTWIQPKDLEEGDWFFHFEDLKPGDWGEDTISLHVYNNDSWLCADVTVTSNQDNGWTEPELTDEDAELGDYTAGRGELGDRVNFFWWADDGDNVYEVGEQLLPAGPLGHLGVGETATVPLADANGSIWPQDQDGPLPGDSVRYIGKAWCFGDTDFEPYAQDGEGNPHGGPVERPITCDGSQENNHTQTDSLTADISFRAVQSRHNGEFVCVPERVPEFATLTVDKRITFSDILVPGVVISDFTLTVDGPGGPYIVTDEVPLAGLAPGAYSVSEAYVGGELITFDEAYDLDCSDEGDHGDVALLAGDNKTCRITNEVEPAPQP